MIKTKGLIIAVVIVFILSLWNGCASAGQEFEFQKGMCYVTWSKAKFASKESDESIKEMAKTGTNWVAVTVTWYQDTCASTEIFPTHKTPSDEGLVHAIKTIHSLGMKVMLKPHLDILDTSGGAWRGEIACTPLDWDAWFESYKNFMLYYARIAQDNKAEMFCMGTELSSVATIKEKSWKGKVIQPIREVYDGPLTYAANWNEEYLNVVFWDVLDYVGIDAYFPLSQEQKPTFEEIMKGWEPWVEELETFQAKVNKPIFFPEVGYCSAQGTAKTPWEEIVGGTLDLELQADCYRALLETFWNKDWFYGMYWWRWGADMRYGGPANRGYSLQNKPAHNVVKKWYKKSAPKKKDYAK